ncbi:hypothetical protein BOX15_Mlig018157g2, partial [Macrostomum lignano]
RFGRLRAVYRLSRRRANRLLTCHLLAANCVICGVSSCLGDIISQRLESTNNDRRTHSWSRTATISLCGLMLGPLSHYWYLYLDRRFVGRTGRSLAYKLLFDTIFFSPLYITLYVLALGLLRKSTLEEVRDDLIESGLTIYKYEATVWTAAQVFNFYFLPTRLRVTFDNLVSLGFDTLYSYRLNRSRDERKSAEVQQSSLVIDRSENK